MITIQCHQCRKKFQVKDEIGGQTVNCEFCGADNVVPDAEAYHKYVKAIELIDKRSDQKQVRALKLIEELEEEIGAELIQQRINDFSHKVLIHAIRTLLKKGEKGREYVKGFILKSNDFEILRKAVPGIESEMAMFLSEELKKRTFEEKHIVQILPFLPEVQDEAIFDTLDDIDEQFPNLIMIVKQIRVKLLRLFEDMPEQKKSGCSFVFFILATTAVVLPFIL
ncbi:MAG: hypothetical protein K8S87_05095 [Planctomycetes bacterium]|nr:hypothetical protein [Planctomycetota bacterium]